jgi:hypothetical protein
MIGKSQTQTRNVDAMSIPAEFDRTGKVKSNGVDVQALLARIAELEQQVAQKTNRTLTLKVSEKGAVSLYGLGRFPVTLFGGQWLKVLDMADDIRKFIETNRDKLAWK